MPPFDASKAKPASKGRKADPAAKHSPLTPIPPPLTYRLLTSGSWIDEAGSKDIQNKRNLPEGWDWGEGRFPIDFLDVVAAAEISSLLEESSLFEVGAEIASIAGEHLVFFYIYYSKLLCVRGPASRSSIQCCTIYLLSSCRISLKCYISQTPSIGACHGLDS